MNTTINKINPTVPKESSYQFKPLGLGRSMLIKPYVFKDLRGAFFETFHLAQFEDKLNIRFVQDCVSVSNKNVLRGIHGDFRTWKLIHCPKGAVLACIVDLNPSSPTYFKSISVQIDDQNRNLLLVPPGFGNSFLVLSEMAVYSYKKSSYFQPNAEFTLHYKTAETGIDWPVDLPIVSARDTNACCSKYLFEKEMRHRTDLVNNPFL